MHLLHSSIGLMTIRTIFCFLTSIQYLLEGATLPQYIRAGIPHLFQYRSPFRIDHQYARAGFAYALQYIERVLQIANVKTRQCQFDVAEVSGAIGQFEFTSGARGGFVGYAQPGI